MGRQLHLTKFRDLSLADPFFDSLKAGYQEFPEWFNRKAAENVYVVKDDQDILSGMVYLKLEQGAVLDVEPPLPEKAWLKVGTLKIEGRGTKLGERVVKKIFDTAISVGAEAVYVTVFEVYDKLIELFERYGFQRRAIKRTDNGIEQVYVRSLTDFTGDRLTDYPFIHTAGNRAWLLAIYPEFHTRLLPDSILRNEPREIIEDVSPTNTIHKVYIAGLSLNRMTPGDIVVLYRTTDIKGRAYFRSVVTSICVVEEVRSKREFPTLEAFLAYTRPRSVFSEDELRAWYEDRPRAHVVKMTYNVALEKRPTRGQLLDAGIVSVQPRWDFRPLSHEQLTRIVEMGGVNARLIID